ncbi:hypothetical protein NQ314_006799 [Rhamnusium bicolor]|uniref:tRNA (guanine-N(7)-)-methyltransferase non-catalytic subunit wuho n=1 Tax=Rhamnusium bicolor TaxID=1586634 RepID=A0AAV8YYH2_9CUCU|nr:hypothetical protein NQ314_006799 [Rhamnusium bicolor]
MVLIKKINADLIFASNDSIITFNLENRKSQNVKIPEPILPENLTKGQVEVLKKEVRNITSFDFSKSGDYIVVATENKQVVLYDKNFVVIKNFIVNRSASKVCFTPTNDILVADKTGDIYLYKLNSETDEPNLLLGHLSVILDVVLSECGKYILTCDRDEKIRVSCFPNAYNIVSFCLGHTEFVTNIKLIKSVLLSASGDGTIRIWNYIKGEQLSIINTNEHIKEHNLIEIFAKQMDTEKVDVTALPVSDMQIYEGIKLYIAVSIHSYNGIQLYNIDLLTYKPNYIAKIEVSNFLFTFCLSDHLYILSDKLLVLKLIDGNFVQLNDAYLDQFYHKYKNILSLHEDNFITVLYKRKFDNVQEYLERKKQRLEAK